MRWKIFYTHELNGSLEILTGKRATKNLSYQPSYTSPHPGNADQQQRLDLGQLHMLKEGIAPKRRKGSLTPPHPLPISERLLYTTTTTLQPNCATSYEGSKPPLLHLPSNHCSSKIGPSIPTPTTLASIIGIISSTIIRVIFRGVTVMAPLSRLLADLEQIQPETADDFFRLLLTCIIYYRQ